MACRKMGNLSNLAATSRYMIRSFLTRRSILFSSLLVISASTSLGHLPTLTWYAAQNLDGDAQWPALQDAGRSWTFGGPVVAKFGATDFPGAPAWFNAPAANQPSLDGVGGSNQNVSWELVFRPGDLVGSHVIFETGGNGDGTAFVLQGAQLYPPAGQL